MAHDARATVTAALTLLLAGCGESPSPSPVVEGTATTRDSASVQLIEYSAVPTGLPVWRIADTPEVRIGALEHETER